MRKPYAAECPDCERVIDFGPGDEVVLEADKVELGRNAYEVAVLLCCPGCSWQFTVHV